MDIARYHFHYDDTYHHTSNMLESNSGEYVLYQDHLKQLTALEEENTRLRKALWTIANGSVTARLIAKEALEKIMDKETGIVHYDPVDKILDNIDRGMREGKEKAIFKNDLRDLINTHSRENGSDTPDFILAQYIENCLFSFEIAIQDRETWYGRKTEPPNEIP